MGVDMKVKAIYDSEIGNITRTDKNWKDVLKVAGQLYRYEFDNIVMVTAQRSPSLSISSCVSSRPKSSFITLNDLFCLLKFLSIR